MIYTEIVGHYLRATNLQFCVTFHNFLMIIALCAFLNGLTNFLCFQFCFVVLYGKIYIFLTICHHTRFCFSFKVFCTWKIWIFILMLNTCSLFFARYLIHTTCSLFFSAIYLLFSLIVSRFSLKYLSSFFSVLYWLILNPFKIQVSKDIKYADKQPIVPWGPRFVFLWLIRGMIEECW